MKPPYMDLECVVARALVITFLALCVCLCFGNTSLLSVSLSAGTTESVQMPSVISKMLRKPAVTYQGSFDLPPVALRERLEA